MLLWLAWSLRVDLSKDNLTFYEKKMAILFALKTYRPHLSVTDESGYNSFGVMLSAVVSSLIMKTSIQHLLIKINFVTDDHGYVLRVVLTIPSLFLYITWQGFYDVPH